MSVDPLKPHRPSQTDVSRLGTARRSEPGVEETSPERPALSGDSVELSAASRTLVDASDETGRAPQGTLSHERMREVLRRLQNDFYQRDEVHDTIARGVRRDLGLPPAE
jgi:hypothetical protein